MATAMLPGLGGGTGGVQLTSGQLANSTTAPMAAQNAAAATASGSVLLPNTSAPLLSAPGAVQPGATLPLPTVNPNVNFFNTSGAPAGTPVQQPNVPGTSMPASSTPPPTNLPTPQVTPAPAMQMGANGALPQGLTPLPTVTQMMNTPQMNTPAEFAAKFGTAATTPDLAADTAKKYTAAFDANKNASSPTTKGDAGEMVQTALDQNTPKDNTDPIASATDAYAAMNPVVKTMFDNINQLLSQQNTRTSLVDEFTKLETDSGITADKLALMNINNVMAGTEDDIRNEITKTGGFATNSQVMALTAARNKVLQTQATALQDTITAKDDYVKQIMTLTQADQAETDKQVSEQIGLDEKVAEMQINLDQAAKDNYYKQLQFQQTQDAAQVGQYDKTLTASGNDYTAFASTIPDALKGKVESLMGLAPGTLSNPNELAYLTASSLKQQQLAQAGQKIQISLNNAGSLDDYRAALTDLAGARTNAAQATAVNSTIKSLYGTSAANPITAYRTASIWIGNVNAAYAKSSDPANANKGASDLELIDAAVKLNNGGQQVTQVQVDALQQAIGYPGKITVTGGKITGISGLLDSGTRTAIRDLATSNLIQKRIGATQATDTINSTLSSRGTPTNYNLPQIQAAMIPEGYVNQGTAADGQTTVYLMPDNSIVDANGQNYDSGGNPI